MNLFCIEVKKFINAKHVEFKGLNRAGRQHNWFRGKDTNGNLVNMNWDILSNQILQGTTEGSGYAKWEQTYNRLGEMMFGSYDHVTNFYVFSPQSNVNK